MRPVEELQRDVLHLLLVDHAEVQAVVHVVLAQGPAPHARRHLASLPSPQRSSGSRSAARRGPTSPAARAASRAGQTRRAAPAWPRGGARPAAPHAHAGRDGRRSRGRGGEGGATPPLSSRRWERPFSVCPPPRSRMVSPEVRSGRAAGGLCGELWLSGRVPVPAGLPPRSHGTGCGAGQRAAALRAGSPPGLCLRRLSRARSPRAAAEGCAARRSCVGARGIKPAGGRAGLRQRLRCSSLSPSSAGRELL